jgi:hypothetical protein
MKPHFRTPRLRADSLQHRNVTPGFRTPPPLDPLESLDLLEQTQPKNVCELAGKNGLPTSCNSLNLGLSLLKPYMARIAANVSVTGYTGKARLTVACPGCKRQKSLSLHFGNFAHLLLLWKSTELLADGDTSIIFRLEARPTGTESSTAFGKWVIEPINDTILAGMQSVFGKDSGDK